MLAALDAIHQLLLLVYSARWRNFDGPYPFEAAAIGCFSGTGIGGGIVFEKEDSEISGTGADDEGRFQAL